MPEIDGSGRALAADEHQEQPVNDLPWLTAAEIGAAYAARSLSPVELVQALIDRIETRNADGRRLHQRRCRRRARCRAAAEKEIFAGRALGPLHGVPYGIKDNIDVAGQPTTCHSKILLDNVAREDAPSSPTCARPARSCSASSRCTSSPSAARPRTCRFPMRAIPGTPPTIPAARPRAPASRWRPASCRCRSAPTPAARSATRPAIAAWSG